MTGSLDRAIKETNRRRVRQMAYNEEHGITPMTIKKKITSLFEEVEKQRERQAKKNLELEAKAEVRPIDKVLAEKEKQMREAAKNLEFELAALLRDEVRELRKKMGGGQVAGPKA
jgi:excinuclease ABC subunit B